MFKLANHSRVFMVAMNSDAHFNQSQWHHIYNCYMQIRSLTKMLYNYKNLTFKYQIQKVHKRPQKASKVSNKPQKSIKDPKKMG